MRTPAKTIAAITAGALALAACGNSGVDETPAACLKNSETYREALTRAPGEVRFEDGTAISACVVEGQPGGELSTVGEALVPAATQLNEAARADPGGPETVQLGYLIGAVQRGASDTGGIHADLIRRLDAASRFAPGSGAFPSAFEEAYDEGYAAGQANG